MRHSRWIQALGIIFIALVALSIAGHSTIRAGQPSPAVVSATTLGGAFGGGDSETKPTVVNVAPKPASREATKVWLKLQEKIPLAFPIETSLEDVLKSIQQSTIDKTDFPEGIPYYINPIGLQEADKTSTSTMMINLKGISLATSLKLALDQIGLAFWIHPDGLLVITNKESEDIPVEAENLILKEVKTLREEVKTLREEIRFSRGMAGGSGMSSGPLLVPPQSKPGGGMANPGGMM
jgi:hypothetical protein